jgi:hypothetical protein
LKPKSDVALSPQCELILFEKRELMSMSWMLIPGYSIDFDIEWENRSDGSSVNILAKPSHPEDCGQSFSHPRIHLPCNYLPDVDRQKI